MSLTNTKCMVFVYCPIFSQKSFLPNVELVNKLLTETKLLSLISK